MSSRARPTAPPPVSTGSWSLAPLKNAPIHPPARRPTPTREMRKFYLHSNVRLPTVPWRPHRTSAPLVLFHFYILPCARSVARRAPRRTPLPPPFGAPICPLGPAGSNLVSIQACGPLEVIELMLYENHSTKQKSNPNCSMNKGQAISFPISHVREAQPLIAREGGDAMKTMKRLLQPSQPHKHRRS